MIGVAITSLGQSTLTGSRDRFCKLQETHPIHACEIHFEASLYPAAVFPWDAPGHPAIASLRQAVEVLGVHLPFYELNPLARNPRTARLACDILEESISAAAACRADYVVFHGRGTDEWASPADRILHWREIITPLARLASEAGLKFCLENADDIRLWPELTAIADGNPCIHFCLDTGHLYERVLPQDNLMRFLLKVNDRINPLPILVKQGLPISLHGSLQGAAQILGSRLACIHLHNHNGRTAHQPLARGVIPTADLAGLCRHHTRLPLIIEADYEGLSVFQTLEKDLQFLEELCR